jgi:hypothetical protein
MSLLLPVVDVAPAVLASVLPTLAEVVLVDKEAVLLMIALLLALPVLFF